MEDRDPDDVQENSNTQFTQQVRRKEQEKGEKYVKKNQKGLDKVEEHKNPHQKPYDSP